jgi:hypothetical protein
VLDPNNQKQSKTIKNNQKQTTNNKQQTRTNSTTIVVGHRTRFALFGLFVTITVLDQCDYATHKRGSKANPNNSDLAQQEGLDPAAEYLLMTKEVPTTACIKADLERTALTVQMPQNKAPKCKLHENSSFRAVKSQKSPRNCYFCNK